ncbi:P-loop containing nucleoside triphosphate hydrolase protein [Mycena crocata]|nr:P-loop containing nucleoside triphosphate hydrolase protein [Mycena crocata]
MDSLQLSALSYLTQSQKGALKKGNLETVADLLLVSPQDLGRRCRISPIEAGKIIKAVCEKNAPQIRSLASIMDQEQTCSTGDSYLDAALGGGIRTGMIWEVFGQSAAGKTQLALQLSLLVQLPTSLGGLSGSACYITISSNISTKRLVQIVDAHPALSQDICGLDDIHTIKSPSIPNLLHVLSKILPDIISEKADNPAVKPVKLVVIDALAELFHTSDKTTTSTLIDRSQHITDISLILHTLANKHNIAVLVLNEVSDVFNRGNHGETSTGGDLLYNQQSRWFGSADTVPGEDNKEASLGLVWANQVNVRVMMSRTGRRRYFEDDMHNKRQKADGGISSGQPDANQHSNDGATLIRRMSVVFSSVAPTCSLDYIVTAAGICILPDEDILSPPESALPPLKFKEDSLPTVNMLASQVAPLDVGFAEHDAQSQTALAEDEEWESYWNADEISEEMYNSLQPDI